MKMYDMVSGIFGNKAAFVGKAAAVVAAVRVLTGCPQATDETPAKPLPRLTVENFSVDMKIPTYTDANGVLRQIYPVDKYNAEAKWSAVTGEGYQGMSITNENPAYNTEVGKEATTATINGVTSAEHVFTATPKGAAGQEVEGKSATATKEEDGRDRDAKLDAWLRNPARKEWLGGNSYTSPLSEETIQDVKDTWRTVPIDQVLQEAQNGGWISKAPTPKNKFIANQNRIVNAEVSGTTQSV